MTMLKLRLFGGFALNGTDGPPLPTRKAEALLAYLAMPAGRAHRRDKLAALLWGDRGDVQARHSLAQTLYVIRRTLGRQDRNALIVNSRSVTLDPSRIEIDVSRFETFAAESTPISLGEAAELYRDEMLAGFYLPEEAFEVWLLGEQRRLLGLALATLERLLRHQIDELNDAAAIETARRLLALDPLQETVHRALMRLQYRAGRKGAAVRQYQTCAKVLRHELGIEPDEATAALYREILNDRTNVTERRGSQISGTAGHGLARSADLLFPTEENKTKVEKPFLHVIDLDGNFEPLYPRLDWVQVKGANQDWVFEPEVAQGSDLENTKPAIFFDGYFGKAVEYLGAIFLWMKPSEQEVAERRRRYQDRMLVVPPSMRWSYYNAMPGGMIFPSAIYPR